VNGIDYKGPIWLSEVVQNPGLGIRRHRASQTGDLFSGAFRIVVNLAILLQSLDADGDPTSGIDISPEVEGLFDGVELNLSQAAEAFQADKSVGTPYPDGSGFLGVARLQAV
jgi:hypothetical protein